MTCSKKPTGEPGLILGYTTRRHLLLDLDNTGLDYALRIVSLIFREWPEVGDCLVLESTTQPDQVRLAYNKWGRPLVIHDRPNYHLVFDNLIGYNQAASICRVLAALGVLEEDYDKIREFRGDMTLRVSHAVLLEQVKPVPREAAYSINMRANHSDGYIGEYRRFKKMGKLAARGRLVPEGVTDNRTDAAHDDA
jgi:hypothetical protein